MKLKDITYFLDFREPSSNLSEEQKILKIKDFVKISKGLVLHSFSKGKLLASDLGKSFDHYFARIGKKLIIKLVISSITKKPTVAWNVYTYHPLKV